MNNHWQTTWAITIMWLMSYPALSKHLVAQSDVEMPGMSVVRQAVAKIDAAVVQIETIGGKDEIGGMRVTNQPRTGLIVDPRGFVVTAAFNVAHEPTTIFVTSPGGKRVSAEIVSRNHSRQLVMLKFEPAQALPATPAMLDRSRLSVGQTTIAVGRTMDSQQANISTGIISATRRIRDKAVQTDASISPHNFGGPLIDLDGNVIGILVPMSPQGKGPADGTEWYDSGIGFAVPVTGWELDQMQAGNDLNAGLLAVTFKEDQGYASRPVIAACPGNSPAARAGMQPGDEITKVNGLATPLLTHVRHALGPRYAGQRLSIEFIREGVTRTVEVELVEKIEPWQHAMLGIVGRSADDGIYVTRLVPDGPAQAAGVQVGDRLVSLDGQLISDQFGIESDLMTRAVNDTVRLVTERGGIEQEVSLKLVPLSADIIESEPTDAAATASQLVPIKVPESPSVCHGYFPDANQPSALLMWIGQPGKQDAEEIVKDWKAWCDQTNTALLIPQSLDEARWSRDELEFLNKVTRQAREQFDIDPYRIAVGGSKTGGVMASLVAMSDKEAWRGLILLDAVPSSRVAPHQSEPAQRQLILILESDADERLSEEMGRWTEHFQAQKIPVHRQDSSENVQQQITGWLTTLSRF